MVIAAVSGLHLIAAPDVLRILGAVVLIGFGAYKFLKPRSHPRWVGLRLRVWATAVIAAGAVALFT